MKFLTITKYVLSACLAVITPTSNVAFGQKISELYSINGEIVLKTRYNGNREVRVATTAQRLHIYYKSWSIFKDITYQYGGNSYSVSLSNNIKDVAMDRYGTIYLTTLDDQLLYFYEGKLVGGVPVIIDGLYTGSNGNVYGVLKLPSSDIVVPVKILDKIGNVDFLVHINIYPELKQLMKDFNPKGVTFDDNMPMVLANSGDKLGLIHESGHKVKVYDDNTSFFPCKIKAIDNRLIYQGTVANNDRGNYNHIACICDDNALAFSRHKVDTKKDIDKDMPATAWKYFSKNVFKGNVLEIKFGTLWENAKDVPYVFGYTDALKDQVFLYNPEKDEVCFINIPGNKKVLDYDFSENVVTTGDKVYKIDFANYTCKNGISTSTFNNEAGDNNFKVFPNPSSGLIHLPHGLDNIKIFNLNGIQMVHGPVIEADNYNIVDISQHPIGLYIMHAYDRYNDKHVIAKIFIAH